MMKTDKNKSAFISVHRSAVSAFNKNWNTDENG